MTAPIPVYDIFDMYVDFLVIEKQHLPLTIETYKQEIRFFCGFLEQNALHVQNVSLDVIQSYIIERNTKKELSGKTINKIVSTLNSFFLFCIKEKHVHQNPLQFLSKAKTTITYPNAMTEQQVQTVLESIDVSTVLGLRDKAIFELIYACGLRIHEVVNLQLSSLFLDDEYIVVHGKGDKIRIVPVGEQANDVLQSYLQRGRPKLIQVGIQYSNVFLNYRGEPISRKGIWKKFKALLGPELKHFKVHSLRHSFATHLLQSGMNLRAVQELLGHADISTTSIYTNISDTSLKKSHAKYHPK